MELPIFFLCGGSISRPLDFFPMLLVIVLYKKEITNYRTNEV